MFEPRPSPSESPVRLPIPVLSVRGPACLLGLRAPVCRNDSVSTGHMNRTVNLTKRVQTCKGLRYCTVVLAMNVATKMSPILFSKKTGVYTRDGRK